VLPCQSCVSRHSECLSTAQASRPLPERFSADVQPDGEYSIETYGVSTHGDAPLPSDDHVKVLSWHVLSLLVEK